MLNTLLDYRLLIPVAIILGFAPFHNEPHLTEKLRMLTNGTLRRPCDMLDLCWHAWPLLLLVVRIGRDTARKLTARVHIT